MAAHILPFEPKSRIRLMFMDEAGFGRINKPKRCWCPSGVRPTVPCHHVREYRYAFGAVEPAAGDDFFLISSHCDTVSMGVFLRELSAEFADDYILLGVDRASWPTSKKLVIPDNIRLFFLPPYTPEFNPAEQIWREIRSLGFKNEFFISLDKVIDRLTVTINSLSKYTIKSITGRHWILSII